VLVAGLNRGDRSPSADPSGATTESTPPPSTTASTPATTAAPSPTATWAGELRSAAGRLSPSDGARAADLASQLRQVADQVEAGSGGGTATGAIISVGAWRLTGQLSESAATTAINLLSRVPGVTVVTLPSQPVISVPTAPAPGGNTRGTAKPDDNGKGKGKDD
ncbi:MAG TPA: hypothetical protein VGV86_14385, partial [Acidimicrobiales bacterium]|nr:hypothetical protein [Acidimicrobiales bacterium]